ncbi:histidine kinase [uncultured Methylobacterium sp.]|uniref:histidine kinase n=1 Tax=uncultured Methylobacterium sp. TaxID=157278 RepID=UPI0035CA6FFD
MADYYPLLARALDALPDRSPDLRKAVYDRARGALIGQLRSIVPPLAEGDIERESDALEAAIDRLEGDYGGTPLPIEVFAPADDPIPEPIPPPPTEPVLPPADQPTFEAAEPALVDLPEPSAPVIPLPARPIDAPIGITAPLGKAAEPAADPPPEASPAEEASDPQVHVDASGRQRPRIDIVAPRRSNARLLRNVFVGTVLALVIGLIATAAYLLRDKPTDLPVASESQSAPADNTEAKYADRVGGDAPPPATERPATPSSTTTVPPPLPAQPDVAVAQRAVLIEENREAPNSPPAVTQGRVIWRLDAVSGERGQALETAVQATIEFPEAGLNLALTLRRNLDATLPASHTIELVFTNTAPAGSARAVQDVGLIQAKDDETGRGSPMSGLPVRVRENLFLIGLSSLRNDVDRNSDLLLQKNWFDLALRFSSGTRAVITFEKGSSGIQVMQNAFDQWRS